MTEGSKKRLLKFLKYEDFSKFDNTVGFVLVEIRDNCTDDIPYEVLNDMIQNRYILTSQVTLAYERCTKDLETKGFLKKLINNMKGVKI
jgi:hypothetical protein